VVQPLTQPRASDTGLSAETRATLHTASHILSAHIQEINVLLDTSFSNISNQFITISSMVSALASLSDNEARSAKTAEISALISKTIMDMQFQDRVSQNLVITSNILKATADTLNVDNAQTLDTPLADTLVHLLNLGDIKQKFFAYALERGWVDASTVPTSDTTAPASDDDIELF
jgi:hypothetical protein